MDVKVVESERKRNMSEINYFYLIKKGRALNNKDIGSCCQKHYLKGMRNCLMEGLVY